MSKHRAFVKYTIQLSALTDSPKLTLMLFVFLVMSVTRSIHAQDNCQPDLQATMLMDQNSIQGASCLELMMQIDEVAGSPTCANAPIIVTLAKDINFTIRYSEFASSLGQKTVSNKDWNYKQSATHHIWTYKRSNLRGNGRTTIGFTGIYNPRFPRGSTSFTMSIQSGSGGEISINNNTSVVNLEFSSGDGNTTCTPIMYTSPEQEEVDNDVYEYQTGQPPVVECYDQESGGYEVETFYYSIPVNQEVTVEFNPYNVPDNIDIYVNDVLVSSSGCNGGSVYNTAIDVNGGDLVKIVVDGECSGNSGTAWIMQVCGVDLTPCEAPQFIEQPEDQEICNGDDVTLHVLTTGDGVSIRWFYKDHLDDEWIPTSQTGTAMLETNLTSTRFYGALALGDCGELWSETAKITVLVAAGIGTINSIQICEGENAILTVGIWGDAPYTLTPYIDDQALDQMVLGDVETATIVIPSAWLSAGLHTIRLKIVNQCNEAGSYTDIEMVSVLPNAVWYLDEDGDGFHNSTIEDCVDPGGAYTASTYGEDCDDTDEHIHPGATEICDNGIDEDCQDGDAISPNFTLSSTQSSYFEGEDIQILVEDLVDCTSCAASWIPNLTGGDIDGISDNIDIPGNRNITQTYQVTISNQGGCSLTHSIDVLVKLLPDVTAIPTDANCGSAGSVTFTWVPSPDRGAIRFGTQISGQNIDWITPSFSENAGTATIELDPGSYDLWTKWGDNTGTVHIGPVTIEENPLEIESIVVVHPIDEECPDAILGSIDITVSNGGQLEYSINGIDFQGNPIFNNLIAGTYQIVVRDISTNCEDSQTVDVVEIYCDPCYSDVLITEQSDELLANERLRSVDYITINGISVPTNFSVYSGTSIEFEGPFQIVPGAEFLATIDDCDCNEGDPCDDGNSCTIDDVYDADCYCIGEVDPNCTILDCPDLANYGDPCDDGIACTIDDVITIFCECEGIQDPNCTPDCVDGSNYGDVCDDGDACTIGDQIDQDCQCVGTTDPTCDPSACPMGAELGDSCDDLDDCTIDDAYLLNDEGLCECKGQLVDENQNGICDDLEACDPDEGLYAKTLKAGSCNTSSQLSVSVTEFSNGDTGSDEYIELFVKGGGTYDLRGLIVDDKEGQYKLGNGVSKGRIRFADHPNWARVRGGSIILIYNHKNKNHNIGADDPTDSNVDRIYVTPLAQPYFYGEQLTKTAEYYPIAPTWDLIWLYDKNDEINIRDCRGTLLQTITYGFADAEETNHSDHTLNLKLPVNKREVYKDLIGNYELGVSKPSPGDYNNRRHKHLAKNGK